MQFNVIVSEDKNAHAASIGKRATLLSSWKLFDPNVAADLDLFLAGGLFASVHFPKLGLSCFFASDSTPQSCLSLSAGTVGVNKEGRSEKHQTAESPSSVHSPILQ